MMKHFPNIITILRIVASIAVPFLILDGRLGVRGLAFGLFAFAAITDWLDGYLARRWNVLSKLGQMLDPIADKLLITGSLLALVAADRAHLPILYPALLIIFREIFVSGLREYLGMMRVALPVTSYAKYKTALQFIAIGMVIFYPFINDWHYAFAAVIACFYLATALTLLTGIDYFMKATRHV